jgi:acyl-CoA synthetase (NDP forming)
MSKNGTLESIFNPTSIAIAGVAPAGAGQFNTGQLFLDTILEFGFKGKVYPLNPRGGESAGLRVYANIKDVPEPVDYLISCIPAPRVPQLIKDCAAKGVKVVCLFTAGFSETGSDKGQKLEEEIRRLAQVTGVRIIGPNCMGVYSPKVGLSFAPDFPKESGRVALICQSGGNTLYLVRAAAERGVRFSKVISYGNACDIDESELLEYFIKDDETDIVAAYIEGVKDGRWFCQVLKGLSAVKPVVVLKGGYTQAGVGAAASHTGSLAGSDEVWDTLLSQAGAIRVYSLDELVDMMVTFLYMPVPQGRRAGIFGVGGGATVLATDECAAAGFVLPPLLEEIKEELRSAVGNDAGTILGNPIDFPPLVSSNETYLSILRKLSAWEGIDLLLFQVPLRGIMLSLPLACAIFDAQLDNIIKVYIKSGKPIAVIMHYLASGESWQAASNYQRKCYEAGLPVYHSIASAVKAIDRLLRYHEKRLAAARKGC